MRRTGRTTRMLAHAKQLAREGKAVYVVFANMAQAETYKTPEREALGIKFESVDTLRNFDWRRWKLNGGHPNCEVLVDHFAIEHHWGTLFTMAHRWDATGMFFDVGDHVVKDTGDYEFEGYVVSRFFKRRSGEIRYVVENDAGMCMIMNHSQLRLAPTPL